VTPDYVYLLTVVLPATAGLVVDDLSRSRGSWRLAESNSVRVGNKVLKVCRPDSDGEFFCSNVFTITNSNKTNKMPGGSGVTTDPADPAMRGGPWA